MPLIKSSKETNNDLKVGILLLKTAITYRYLAKFPTLLPNRYSTSLCPISASTITVDKTNKNYY